MAKRKLPWNEWTPEMRAELDLEYQAELASRATNPVIRRLSGGLPDAWGDGWPGRRVYVVARDGATLTVEHAGGACGGAGTWCVIELHGSGAFRRQLYYNKDGWEVQS